MPENGCVEPRPSKPETKPERYERERAALMFDIAQEWTRVYTIADLLGIDRPSRPRDWEHYWRLPDLATARYSGRHAHFWFEAITRAADIDADIREFCERWEHGARAYDRVWFMYLTWLDQPRWRSLPTLAVGCVEEQDIEQQLIHALEGQRAQRERWESHVLRRREGAGRKEGSGRNYSDAEFKAEYAAAYRRVRDRNLREHEPQPPTVLDVCNEMEYPISNATFYRYLRSSGAKFPPELIDDN